MRRLGLLLFLATVAGAPQAYAAGPCDHAVAHHRAGLVVVCDIVGTGVIVVVGDGQYADCPRPDGNVMVLVGDDNHVECDGSLLRRSRSECEGGAYAVEVSGEAHSCGLTIVLIGKGSGQIALVGVGKAEGGSIAVVGHGCATQNEEGLAIGVVSNSCGSAVLPRTRAT